MGKSMHVKLMEGFLKRRALSGAYLWRDSECLNMARSHDIPKGLYGRGMRFAAFNN